jgi:hypothetical protein
MNTRYHDPVDPYLSGNIPHAKLVLRNLIGRRDLKTVIKIAQSAKIDEVRMREFRAGRVKLTTKELERLTQIVLYGLAKYDAETDMLVSTVLKKQGWE